MRAGPQLNQLTKPLLIAVIALTGGFEGYRLIAYQDSGGVWTACYGETLGIQPDARFSPEECDAMFGASLSRHNTPLESLSHELPAHVHMASLDLAYNIGTHAFQRSTMYQLLEQQDYPRACLEPLRWRFVNSKDCRIAENRCRGIVVRRQITSQVCLGDMSINDALKALGQSPLDADILEQLNADAVTTDEVVRARLDHLGT